MKEKYVSPAILFESFALAQSIARNCGDTHTSTLGESTHYSPYSCTWDAGGVYLFFESHCEDYDAMGLDPGDEDDPDLVLEFEGLCYNNPDGGQELFSST